LTLVFRNDPLESLKVSSTFDSIPFVREYLQKEIEMQLRTLMMEELPAIIHRLSLRLWCPDYGPKEEEFVLSTGKMSQQDVVDPLASPPQDAVDTHGNVLDSSEILALSLDGGSEIHSLFSQKNMLRLAALDDSQRTLSLFTPSIREAVFRAWACPSERSDGSSPSGTPNLIRSHSAHGSLAAAYTFSDHESGQLPSRPLLANLHSVTTGLSLGAGRHSRTHGRKKKTRVVNLRKPKTSDDLTSESSDSASATEPSIAGGSEPAIPTHIPEEPEEELITPPRSPNNRVRFRPREDSIDLGETPRNLKPVMQSRAFESPSRPSVTQDSLAMAVEGWSIVEEKTPELPQHSQVQQPTLKRNISWNFPSEKSSRAADSSAPNPSNSQPQYYQTSTGGVIEQALLMRIASEIVRRARDEKANQSWENRSEREDIPPPAYGSQ
jgi:mitochondrial distribution and morphology protein 34